MGYAYPIDSKVVNNANGTIDYDRATSSAQLRGLIKSMITNGVNLTDSTNLQVLATGTDNTLTVKAGFVIIEGAIKHFEYDTTITLANADATKDRIDTVVARLNLNESVRDIVIDVVQGTASANPTEPTLTRNSNIYEVGLANVLVKQASVVNSQSSITDTRLLNSRCGLATSMADIDTETLFTQLTTDFNTWFDGIKGQLGDDVATSLLNMINTHTHDDRYYTETEVDNLLSSHKHNSENITYDNTKSGLKAKNTQDAIDEICKSSYAFFLNGKEYGSYKAMTNLSFQPQNGSIVEYKDEIHALGGNSGSTTKHYKYDESNDTWVSVSTLPYSFYRGCAVIYDNEIHILGSSDSGTSHYKWNGSSWSSVSTLPSTFHQFCAVIYNNEIHILGGASFTKAHYKWNGSSWTEVGTLPYDFCDGCAIATNDKIHILGSSKSGHYQKHYVYANSVWTGKNALPYSFYNSGAVYRKGYIHLLGSGNSGDENKHYKLKSGTYVNGYVKANTNIYLPYETYPMTDNLEVTTDGYKVTEDGLVEIFVG